MTPECIRALWYCVNANVLLGLFLAFGEPLKTADLSAMLCNILLQEVAQNVDNATVSHT